MLHQRPAVGLDVQGLARANRPDVVGGHRIHGLQDVDVLQLRRYQDVLLTGPLHQNNIACFEAIQDRRYSASCIAIDVNRCSADVQSRGEPKNKKQQDRTLRSHFAMAVGG